jgi:uncharacterized protein YbjT (DUF2867 family)
MNEKPILITNGTGKTGRRVAARLLNAGRSVRIGSRTGRPPFDWEDRATWTPALEGAGAAYVSYYPDIAVPGAPEAIEAFAHDALAAASSRCRTWWTASPNPSWTSRTSPTSWPRR